MQQDTQFEDKF